MSDQRPDIFDKTARNEAEANYCRVVDLLFEQAADEEMSNGKPQHAVYLIYKFLRHGTTSIKLYCGSLLRSKDGVDVYGDPHVLNAARRFVRQSGTFLQIVVEEDIDAPDGARHPLVEAVNQEAESKSMHGRFAIRKAPKWVKERLSEQFPYHFLVMDDRAFRLETDQDQARAVANFGDRTYAKALSRLFDDIWNESTTMENVGYAG